YLTRCIMVFCPEKFPVPQKIPSACPYRRGALTRDPRSTEKTVASSESRVNSSGSATQRETRSHSVARSNVPEISRWIAEISPNTRPDLGQAVARIAAIEAAIAGLLLASGLLLLA